MHRLTRDDARRIAVRAQLLDADRPADVVELAEQLGAIKIDPTAVIAPSEHSICWSRIGWSYEPGQLSKAVEDDRLLFEYDGHFRPSSLLPALWPLMRTRRVREATRQYLDANAAFRADILARLGREGALLAADIPDTSAVQAKNESGWYGSNQVPRMLELMSYLGEVAVSGRVGRQRVWDLAERVYDGVDASMDPAEAEAVLAGRRLQAYGIARQKSPWAGVGAAGEEATVEGSAWRWRVDPEAVEALADDPGGRAAILNPYDRMLFDRPRLTELFDFTFVLEQFKPKHQRVYGYFAHPILVGDRFIGLLDAALDKKKETLVVGAVHELVPFDDDEREMVLAEIRDLGEWLGVPVRGLD
ncbi:winged helix DNA-binding domain-containing protein [Microbacterium sp. EYE_5]|uniref:DNA glycosylase AlkZ-like family protein n=1 Tax=unclassified Microbacterium TaxID=2609290 RepID=UPI002006A3A4|nr:MULTISPECIES: crosslink repair DNA glycosylase YcaQ family protein [unclassified Microbacterium]MCK6080305.1 winged helix DNA-binding domain-containing protein [Microbacterium sp. EYE_382]MCK6085576.1 winged helix DNA-binding domain-containing protein [Microbacterium sp. EYE_384]MCK6122199.1 winged helix DNA-binding domain-containing protein [Microbacterium sp. EYE_80]MCK6126339.1 winged helix DNA-binding domain-containing protein [Microbacterium sp. EYE_79]MCK6141260.1 winged helix DNA-bin